jgi:hypothetical protein
VRGVTARLFREQEEDFPARLMAFRGYELDLPDDFESTIAGERLLQLS